MSKDKNPAPFTQMVGSRTNEAVEKIIPLLESEQSLSPATRRALVDLVSAFERDKYEQTPKVSAEAEANLVKKIAAIADDFLPDTDQEAPLALQEMRDALYGAISEVEG